jgi:DNA-binding transcriptional regulator YdaS (Cro superfamily)
MVVYIEHMNTDRRTKALLRAVKIVCGGKRGAKSQFARKMGISRQLLYKYETHPGMIPWEACLNVYGLTHGQIHPKSLRPDLAKDKVVV